MVNPEKLATLGTYNTVHRQTKHKETAQKNKKISNTDPTIKKTGINSYEKPHITRNLDLFAWSQLHT
jgi:hypothetical protein